MNAGIAHAHESQFGPPSEPISVAKFIQSAVDLESRNPSVCNATSSPADIIHSQGDWDRLSSAERHTIALECSISDITDRLIGVWDNPRLSAHISKDHDIKVADIHGSADRSKKKRRRLNYDDPADEHPEVTALQNQLRGIVLTSWILARDSALFMRAPKNSDHNVLPIVKETTSDTSHLLAGTREAVITFTVHKPLTWGHGYLSRASQHAILSSQTLGDLYETIPCTSNELPEEISEDGQLLGYKGSTGISGCVICVEGLAYGDGQNKPDYADKLLAEIKTMPPEKQPIVTKASTTIHDTPLASLSLRINEPYWLLHRGNCEHFVVIDQIRLYHPSDHPSGYPLTLQITPPLLDLCRACTKVPAVWSIVGDMRLGESPCVMCDPCWKHLNVSYDAEGVIVVPLPKYEIGW